MNHACIPARFVGIGLAAVVTLGAIATAAAQERAWLEMDVVDDQGRTWRPTDGDPVIDLVDVPNRELTVTVRSRTDGVASFVFSVGDVILGTADAGAPLASERSVAVTDGRGDAEEILTPSRSDTDRWPAGFSYHSSSDLELGIDPPHGPQLVYLAFESIELPAAGRVVRAEVRFTADGDSSGPLDLTIYGVPTVPMEVEFQDVEGEASAVLSSLPRSAATVAWSPEPEWLGSEVYATPDLTPIVLETWGAVGTQELRSLALLFEIADGDGTRRAFSFDSRTGRSGARASLHLTVEEPDASAPVSIVLPEGEVVLIVTARARSGGEGAPLATFEVRVTGGASTAPEPPPAPDPTAEPPPASNPTPMTTPALAPAPEPEAPPAPVAEPTTGPVMTIRAVDLRSRSDGVSLLTVVLDAPTDVEVTPVIRFGTCANPGAVLTALRTVLVGQEGSVTEIDVSTAALRLGGFVVALEDDPDACVPIE